MTVAKTTPSSGEHEGPGPKLPCYRVRVPGQKSRLQGTKRVTKMRSLRTKKMALKMDIWMKNLELQGRKKAMMRDMRSRKDISRVFHPELYIFVTWQLWIEGILARFSSCLLGYDHTTGAVLEKQKRKRRGVIRWMWVIMDVVAIGVKKVNSMGALIERSIPDQSR